MKGAIVAILVLLVGGMTSVAWMMPPASAQDSQRDRIADLEERVEDQAATIARLSRQLALLEERVDRLEGDTPSAEGRPAASSADGLNLRFAGSTDSVSEPFVVQPGRLRFAATYSGGSNFIVHLYGPGDSRAFVFNELGPYTGERIVEVSSGSGFTTGVHAGEVVLEVIGAGPWEILITQ